jgi:DNA repair exonuclease SbcCD ATPase subunit
MTTAIKTAPIERLTELQQQVDDARETLRLLETSPRWKPQPGELPLWDRAIELLGGEQSNQDRAEKITAFKRVLSDLETELAKLQADKANADREIQRQAAIAKFTPLVEQANEHAEALVAIYQEIIQLSKVERLNVLEGTGYDNHEIITGRLNTLTLIQQDSGQITYQSEYFSV